MLSAAKHWQYLFGNKPMQILRCAQDDSTEGLFRSLFSPAEIAAPALCRSRAPRSPDASGVRGARDAGIVKKAL